MSVNGSDGSRSAVAIFFVNKHLYTLVGEALPPDAIQRSGDSVRFQESLQFTGDMAVASAASEAEVAAAAVPSTPRR